MQKSIRLLLHNLREKVFVYLPFESFAMSISSCRSGGIEVALNCSYFDQLTEYGWIFAYQLRILFTELFIHLLSHLNQDQLQYSEYVAWTLPSPCMGVNKLKLTYAYAFLSQSQLYLTLLLKLLVLFQYLFTFDFFYDNCKTAFTLVQNLQSSQWYYRTLLE